MRADRHLERSARGQALTIRGLGKSYTVARRAGDGDLREHLWRRLRHGLRRMRREQVWALRDVDLDVARGDVLGIIGRNGAGKSTLLKILSRITEPTTGEARVYGRVGSLLEVGTGFHKELTGRENIYLSGSILGMSRKTIDRLFDEIVAFSGVERYLDTPVKRYSSGMYVRLAFAVAAHLDAEIVIVDEVLAVGDLEFQRKCLGKIGEVARGGRTVLVVSHNMASLQAMCTRAVLLDRGRIIATGSAAECAAEYARLGWDGGELAAVHFPPSNGAAPRMLSARVLCAGRADGRLESGGTLSIEVEFAARRPVQPAFGAVILDGHRVRVVHFSTRYTRQRSLERPVTGGVVRCDFGVVPLTPGQYFVSLYFGDRSQDTHCVESALSFEVVARDLGGLGRPYEARHSLLWWPAQLSLSAGARREVAARKEA